MITNITISHYKSIFEASLAFGGLNVIVGPNGSGKSNILDAVSFLHDCSAEDIDTAISKRHGIDSMRQWSRTKPYNITIDIGLKNNRGSGGYKIVVSSSRGNYRVLEEAGYWLGADPLRPSEKGALQTASFKRKEDGRIKIVNPFVKQESSLTPTVPTDELFLTTLSTRSVRAISTLVFSPIFTEISSFSKYSIYPNTLRNPQAVSKEIVLKEDGSNLASVLKRFSGSKRLSVLKDDILLGLRQIMPNIVDFQVRSAGGFYVPVLRVREDNDDVHDFNLSQISDGTLRTLGLLTAFYQPSAPSKIGVEELEQMVHPGALPVVYEAMESFVRENANRQLFVTTHSPTLLDLFRPEDVLWARFKGGVTHCGHIKNRQMKIIKDHLFTTGELLLAEGFY